MRLRPGGSGLATSRSRPGLRAPLVFGARTLCRWAIRFASGLGGAVSPRWEGPPVTSQHLSCEFKAAGAPERAWPRVPEPPEDLGDFQGAQRGERHLPKIHTFAELNSVNFSCVGDNSSNGVLLPCNTSSTLWPKRRNSFTSVFFFFFLPALLCVHFFVLFKVGQLVENWLSCKFNKGLIETLPFDY